MNVSIPGLSSSSISTSGPIQSTIREATKLSHQRLDAAMTWVDLGRLNHYSGFLRGQAEALFPLEIALERTGIDDILTDWPQRARTPALEHDLSALDIACDPLPLPQFNGAADMLGELTENVSINLGARLVCGNGDRDALVFTTHCRRRECARHQQNDEAILFH